MGNTIFSRQNEIDVLRMLVAQRRLYSAAKKYDLANFWITLIGVLFSILLSLDIIGKVDKCVSTLVVFILALLVRSMRTRNRERAARVQQNIDSRLYSDALNCAEEIWGIGLSATELSHEMSKYNDKDIAKENVRDWYSDYSSYAPNTAIFLCQKENIKWDRELRVSFLQLNIGVLLILLSLICFVSWVAGSFDYAICFMPILLIWLDSLWAYFADRNRYIAMNAVAEEVESMINDNSVNVLSSLIRLQNRIFENRKRAFLIPDWFYKHTRVKMQSEMDCQASLLA